MKSVLHPEALNELLGSGRYYAKISGSLAKRFRHEAEEAIKKIEQNPEHVQEIGRGFRARMLKKFPFSIIYDFDTIRIRIYAVAHHKRRPGYWIERKFE